MEKTVKEGPAGYVLREWSLFFLIQTGSVWNQLIKYTFTWEKIYSIVVVLVTDNLSRLFSGLEGLSRVLRLPIKKWRNGNFESIFYPNHYEKEMPSTFLKTTPQFDTLKWLWLSMDYFCRKMRMRMWIKLGIKYLNVFIYTTLSLAFLHQNLTIL